MSRFSHRPTRLARQRERQAFRQFIMPLAWFLGLVSMVGMAAVGLGFLVEGIWWGRIFDLFLGLFSIPFVLVFLRFLRGHYDKDLSEP